MSDQQQVLEVLEAGRPYTHEALHELGGTVNDWLTAEHARIMAELYPVPDPDVAP